MGGWPFWAATGDQRIDAALDLAGLAGGEHLVDLGCGDGRVLVRAARRGARVTGVELDPELALRARRFLRDEQVDGTVVEGDFADLPLHRVDVVFAFLSPATLQRLRPRLTAELREGARIVTAGYAVPGWEADDAADRCYLYRRPVTAAPVERAARGWSGGGVLVAARPDAPSLVAVKLHHPGGPVAVRVTSADAAPLRILAGADRAEPGDEVVVDLRIEPLPAGAVLAAVLDAGAGGGPFQVFAVADDRPGVWGLSVQGCEAVRSALGRGEVASVLASARRSAAD